MVAGGSGRSTTTTVLWTIAVAFVLGAVTFGVLVVLDGRGDDRSVVVDAPDESSDDQGLGDVGDATGEEPETPPVEPVSVLADGVAFYTVADYSLVARDGDVRARDQDEGGVILATNDEWQALLDDEILDPAQVYAVEVEHRDATDDDSAGWGVHIRFNDAARLAADTADLGCEYRPDNVVAIAAGTELITLLQVSDEHCGSGFPRGEILWMRTYDGVDPTADEAEAEARELAAQMLGED